MNILEELNQREHQDLQQKERQYKILHFIMYGPIIVLIILFLLSSHFLKYAAVIFISLIIWAYLDFMLFQSLASKLKLDIQHAKTMLTIPTVYTEIHLLKTSNLLYEDLLKCVSGVFIKRDEQYIWIKYILNEKEHEIPQMSLEQAKEFINFSSLPN